jgi:hypothetical protein
LQFIHQKLLTANRTQKYKNSYYQCTRLGKIKIVNNVFIKAEQMFTIKFWSKKWFDA